MSYKQNMCHVSAVGSYHLVPAGSQKVASVIFSASGVLLLPKASLALTFLIPNSCLLGEVLFIHAFYLHLKALKFVVVF